jgi:hypothetical protein
MSDANEPAAPGPDEAPEPAPEPGRRPSASIPWSHGFLRPGSPSSAGGWSAGPHVSLSLRLVLAATLVVALAILMWGGRRPSDTLPPDALGTWRTTTASFSDRAFRLSREDVAFGQGGGRLASYRIRRVTHQQVGAVHRYRVTYRAEGGDAEIELEHDPAARTLRMTTRPGVVWRRQ